jgi:glycosyltransferase involved in cell wall biosynthesis
MTRARPHILCVHQGGELYGSDRSFLQAVQAIRSGWPDAWVRVVLAVDGPLRPLLAQVADEVVARDLCILRLANPVSTALKGTVALPWYLAQAARDIARADLAYINTTVVADHIIAARMAPAKSIIHVREIPKPRAMPVIRGLCLASGAGLIYNSAATRDAFAMPAGRRQAVIHNGVDRVPDAAAPAVPDTFTAERPLRIAMLGRINDWKGQDLLIDAAARLPADARARLRMRIVGSTFNDVREPIEALEAKIVAGNLRDVVSLEPFRDDPEEVYRWADLCVVPSRLPEPFGRVAIEAMAHGRPVIAAAHGGLVEIVDDASGWLFPPNDTDALAAILAGVIADPASLSAHAAGAAQRFAGHFSSETMSERLRAVLSDWIPARRV